MTDYRIVCTRQEPATAPISHQHIVQVGTGGDDGYVPPLLTVGDVLRLMAAGNTFHTVSPTTRVRADVHPLQCTVCQTVWIIRSESDQLADNNLDNLPRCA